MSSMPKSSASEVSEAVRLGGTLDSWKEIAFYLKREVRTVQRWEKKEGLPIRRHHHHKGYTVYAIKEEIEAWRRSREPQISPEGPIGDAKRIRSKLSPLPHALLITKYLAVFLSLVEAILADASCQSVSVAECRSRESVLGHAKLSAHTRFDPPQLERVLLTPNEKPKTVSAPQVNWQGKA